MAILHRAMQEQAKRERNYRDSLAHLAGMRSVIDSFFDQVMVNADDNAVRFNRLALLQQLRELFLQVADISVLQ